VQAAMKQFGSLADDGWIGEMQFGCTTVSLATTTLGDSRTPTIRASAARVARADVRRRRSGFGGPCDAPRKEPTGDRSDVPSIIGVGAGGTRPAPCR